MLYNPPCTLGSHGHVVGHWHCECPGEMCCFFEQPDGNLNTDSQSLKVQCVGFKVASSDEVADYNQLNSPPLKSPGEHIVDAKNVKNKGLLKSRWFFLFVCLDWSILGCCRRHLSLYTVRWGWVVFSKRKTCYRCLFINNALAQMISHLSRWTSSDLLALASVSTI